MKGWFGATLLAATALAGQPWPEAHPPTGQQPRRPAGYRPFTYPRTPQDIWRSETAAQLARSREAWRAIDETIARGPYVGTFESIARHRAPEWFADAKFGMFVDWGPWSVAGWAPQAEKATYPDWYEQRLFAEFKDYHARTWGADIGPDDLIELLDGRAFDVQGIASLASAAGMRYVVPFLKHHGGYALWDSSFTHRDSAEWGLKRDLATEMAAACRKAGLRFGTYVSLGEWNYPLVVDGALRGTSLAGGVTGPLTGSEPFLSGKVPVPDFARDYLVPQIAELIDRVDPDMLWFDGEWEAPPAWWRSPEIAAYYYDRAARRGRAVAINDRFGKDTRGTPGWGDYYTSEFHVIEGFEVHPWEENRSLSHSYGYNWEEASDDRFVLSEDASLDLLLGIVSRGGNLLLMVSPDGAGRVPANQVRRLQFIGSWLSRYGDAIYATRALDLPRQPTWGYMMRSKDGRRVFCIVRRWPEDGRLVVPIAGRVRAASTMYSSALVRAGVPSGGTVALELGQVRPPDPHASVVVLTME